MGIQFCFTNLLNSSDVKQEPLLLTIDFGNPVLRIFATNVLLSLQMLMSSLHALISN